MNIYFHSIQQDQLDFPKFVTFFEFYGLVLIAFILTLFSEKRINEKKYILPGDLVMIFSQNEKSLLKNNFLIKINYSIYRNLTRRKFQAHHYYLESHFGG